MVVAAILAELADLATWAIQPLTGHYERNAIVRSLAYPEATKLLLVVAVVSIAVVLGALHRYPKVRTAMLGIAIVAGVVGTTSNLV